MNTFCAYFNQGTCRSCNLIELDYPSQITAKEELLRTELAIHSNTQFLPTVTSQEIEFRNKAKFIVTGTLDRPIIGLAGETNLDQGREILSCQLHYPAINNVLRTLPQFIKDHSLVPYNISTKKGELKGLIIFYSSSTEEMYLRFILRSKESIDRIKKNLSQLVMVHPKISCISVNIQPIAHAILEGKEEIILSSQTSINHRLSNISLQLTPKAFVQTNQNIAEKLYQTATCWIRDLEIIKFVELYCGQGVFSLFAAPYVKSALGIEINPEAVEQATKSARLNGLIHLKFTCADASMVEMEVKLFNPDLILVNPPRKGLGKGIDLLLKSESKYIIYSSCSYESLALDLKILDSKYEVSKVQIFDMFPHTKHFETLVLLNQR